MLAYAFKAMIRFQKHCPKSLVFHTRYLKYLLDTFVGNLLEKQTVSIKQCKIIMYITEGDPITWVTYV